MTFLSTLALARRIDRAEIDFCATAASHGLPTGAAVLERAGGCAVYGLPGSPLNKVLGLGLGTAVSDRDLDDIEAFYAKRRSSVAIEVCPLAAADLPARLCARGYVLQAFENELARSVSATIASEWPDQTPSISVAETTDDSAWLDAVATGFAAAESASAEAPPAIEEVRETAAIMQQFLHPSIRRYLALADGKVAGAGAAFVRDGVLGVFGTATLPRFRRRGVQTALTRQCLLDLGSDADLAIATTLPGSISQRTFERLGFRIVYTRAIFILPAPVSD